MSIAQETYRVTLDAFEGPLDLLLFLIRRAEVDISAIRLAEITEQYLDLLRGIDDVDVEAAGEFLVMAATLIEIKSRTLAPSDPEAGDGAGGPGRGDDRSGAGIDARDDLIRQLLAYQRFRSAAERLVEGADRHAQQAPVRIAVNIAESDDSGEEATLEIEDAHPMDLAEAYERIAASIDFARLGQHVVEMDDTPIALFEEDLLDRLVRSTAGRITLHSAFEGQTPTRRVGFFLATLELCRLGRITVRQDDIDRDIEIVLRAEDDRVIHVVLDDIELHHPSTGSTAGGGSDGIGHG